MIEEAVILIVGEKQRGLAPDRGVGGERVEYLRDVPGAVIGRPIRMLGISLRSDDPGDLRQSTCENVLSERVEQGSCLGDASPGSCSLEQRIAGLCVPVAMEEEQRIVAVVARIG